MEVKNSISRFLRRRNKLLKRFMRELPQRKFLRNSTKSPVQKEHSITRCILVCTVPHVKRQIKLRRRDCVPSKQRSFPCASSSSSSSSPGNDFTGRTTRTRKKNSIVYVRKQLEHFNNSTKAHRGRAHWSFFKWCVIETFLWKSHTIFTSADTSISLNAEESADRIVKRTKY